MIITDKFILLNFPKTGSTFTRKVIKSIFGKNHQELYLPNIRNFLMSEKTDQHGTLSQIPIAFRDRKIVSIIRNPLDRFLSIYAYGAWKQSLPLPVEEIKGSFPLFPKLGVDEFIDLQNKATSFRLNHNIDKVEIGLQSIQLIQMFYPNPQKTLKQIFSGSYSKKDIVSDISDIIFLKQENLREDLIEFLVLNGFDRSELSFIFTEKVSNITNYGLHDKSTLVTEKLKNYIEEKEWLYNTVYKKVVNDC